MNSKGEALNLGLVSFISNVLLTLVKFLAGVFGNSYALIADGIESMADIFSSLLLFLGLKYTQRPADETHPYGHGRLEPLLTFMVVFVLLASATWIAVQSILNLFKPQEKPEVWTLFILVGIVIWKEIMFRIMLSKAKQLNSSTLRAEAWHQRSDSISSIAAIIGITIAVTLGPGFEKADEWAALVAAFVILINAYKILRPAVSEFMDENLYHDLVTQITVIGSGVQGIVNTEKCVIRKVGSYFVVDLHARVNGQLSVREGHEISHRLKDKILSDIPQISHVLIHIEPA